MSSLSTTPLGAQMTGQMRGPSMVIWLCGASVLVFLLWHGIFVEKRIVPEVPTPTYPVKI